MLPSRPVYSDITFCLGMLNFESAPFLHETDSLTHTEDTVRNDFTPYVL